MTIKPRKLPRRGLLTRSAAVAGAAAAATLLGAKRNVYAFGEAPSSGAAANMLPSDRQVDSVLEIFMFGGVSQYETFYLVDEHGQTDNTHWHLFLGNGIETAVSACGLGALPLFEPFGVDSVGNTVNLGPFVAPLRARPDLVERLRVIVTAHNAAPHEVAIPLALSGRRLGHPGLAGVGTHIQRFFQERYGGGTRAPFSYVLLPNSQIQTELVRSASALGQHPGTARPLALDVGQNSRFRQQLLREQVRDYAVHYDSLLAAKVDEFRQRLRPSASEDLLRAPRFGDLAAAAEEVASSSVLNQVLEDSFFDPVEADLCGVQATPFQTDMNLRLAAHLLTHQEAPAKYVCVIDGGLVGVDNAAGGYDTHANTPSIQAENMVGLLSSLAAIINQPGEMDPGKLDLDKTLIVLNTEFGRTPYGEPNNGRGHWPKGYPVVFLGGPIRADSSGVAGGTLADGVADSWATPSSTRVAILMALGIWPFAQESFNVADAMIPPMDIPQSEPEAVAAIRSFHFGS